MGLLGNPWSILVALVAFGAIVGGVAWKAYGMGKDAVYAEQAREKAATEAAIAALVAAGAKQIASIHSKNQPAKERVQREIIHDRIYVDCKSDPSFVLEYNALVGASAPNTTGSGDMHKADTDQ